MNTSDPEDAANDGVEALYRRLAKLDASEPAQATREAILAEARQLAAARAATGSKRTPRVSTSHWGRNATLGALAASILGALVIAPRYLLPGSTERVPPTRPVPAPGANQALQVAPSAGSAADAQLAQGESAAPEATAPRIAPRPSPHVPAPPPALAAKSATPAASGAADATRIESFSDAQRSMQRQAANAASPPAVAGRVAEPGATRQQQLRRAAEAGDVDEIAALASGLRDLNARDAQGRTAVMIATLHGQTAAVTTLLARGADPNVADANGLTPLQAARAAGASDIIATLERYGGR